MPSKNRRTARISAVGSYLPEKLLTNADLEQMMETSDEWIRSRTGIIERHIVAEGETSSDMATQAAKQIMANRDLDPDEIDCIIVATVTPDMLFPATACLVQRNLGAGRAWGFDLMAACSGFLYALDIGARMVESGQYKYILIIGVDAMSTIMDYEDRTTSILFGDGAGAVLLEPCEDGSEGVIDSVMRSDGSGGQYLYMKAGGSLHPASAETVANREHFLRQDGRVVYKQAIKWMADVSSEVAKRNGLSGQDIKLFIPHQANKRIVDACAKRLGLTEEQVLVNIDRYGNTTAATIPLGMADAVRDGRLVQGDKVIIAAFGAGFTWGAMYIKWSQVH
ncbi:MAG: ketoacyl-ACP synthase III [Candidatus Marinimicrobia bacterium]|nr:ketoacyl-ACP synthase III [Candidatus Neomarinimicrobiota bacterium]